MTVDSAAFPERVGRYHVLLPLGMGGLATVYLARAEGVGGFEREVALKLMHAHLRAERKWALELLEEAKLAARIRHKNVVPVVDVGEDPLGVFLVLEYVEGDTLASLQRAAGEADTRLDDAVALRLLSDALAGLHAAHELCDESGASLGLVHRDFSPQNILVGIDGIGRLSDFGIAKTSARLALTREGVVKGKIGYMSPEQARGHPLDRRSDVWAAGVLAWELLCDRRLYKADDEVASLLRIVSETPPRLREARPDLPKALEDAVAWALEPDPRERCPSADAFRRALRDAAAIADEGTSAETVARFLEPTLEARRALIREARVRRAPRRSAPKADVVTAEATTVQLGTAAPKPKHRQWIALASIAVAGAALSVALLVPPRNEAPIEATAAPKAEPIEAPVAAASSAKVSSALEVSADADMVQLTVAGKTHVLARPTREVTLPIPPGAERETLRIEAVAADGRRTAGSVAPGERAELTFPPAVRARPTPTSSALPSNPYVVK